MKTIRLANLFFYWNNKLLEEDLDNKAYLLEAQSTYHNCDEMGAFNVENICCLRCYQYYW